MAPRSGAATARKILATKTTMLKVPLTPAELNEVAEQTYKVEGDLRTFYGHKKEVTSDLKAKEEQLDATLARLGRLGRDKHDYRPVAVRVEADYRAAKVYEIREDTGETIAERAVNEQDRQAPLFDAQPVEAPRATAEDLKDEPCLDCGIAAGKPSPGCEECDHGRTKKAARKAGPAPLAWHELDGAHRAEAEEGEYMVTEGNSPTLDWASTWVPRTGASKGLGRHLKLSDAKAACERHHLELLADAELANAGAGELTKKELKGDATARKKGGRR